MRSKAVTHDLSKAIFLADWIMYIHTQKGKPTKQTD